MIYCVLLWAILLFVRDDFKKKYSILGTLSLTLETPLPPR